MQDAVWFRSNPGNTSLDRVYDMAPTHQRELDHNTSGIRRISALRDLDRQVGTDHTDDLSGVCESVKGGRMYDNFAIGAAGL